MIGGAVGETPEEEESVSVAPNLDVEITVPPGASARQIGSILAEAGVIRSANEFELEVRDQGIANRLRAGSYQLVTGMGIDDVLPVLLRGPVADAYRVTIPEGLRVSEIIAVLADASGRELEDFETALTEGEVATDLRVMPEQPTLSDWEGLLFPDTYEFLRDSPPSEILQVVADTMAERVGGVDWTQLPKRASTLIRGSSLRA